MTRAKASRTKITNPKGAKKDESGPSTAPDAASLLGQHISGQTFASNTQLTNCRPEKAHALLAQSNFELAIKFLQRACEIEPTNSEARELLGIAELEEGDPDAGRQHLLMLLPPHAPAPPSTPSPFLYLAQSAEDPHEALGYYSTAAAMIEQGLGSGTGLTPDEARSMAVRCLVAMIEIWMSDLWQVCLLRGHV